MRVKVWIAAGVIAFFAMIVWPVLTLPAGTPMRCELLGRLPGNIFEGWALLKVCSGAKTASDTSAFMLYLASSSS